MPTPNEDDPYLELEWIYRCLGLGDESDELGKQIFKQLVLASMKNEGISSREIMDKEDVTQAAIVYHLNAFIRAGLIIKVGRKYYLRAQTLENTLEEIENDVRTRLERIRKIARKVEEFLEVEQQDK